MIVANKHKGEVEAGKHTLRFTTNALLQLEDVTKKDTLEFAAQLENGQPKLADIRLLCWAGLLHVNPQLTLDEAGDIMDQIGITKCGGFIGDAFREAFPVSEGKGVDSADENPNQAAD